jgi:hypothetical protein
MIGMIIFGTLADMIGRNAAGIMTSLCMLGGVTVMAFSKYLPTVGSLSRCLNLAYKFAPHLTVDSPKYNTLFLVWR